MLIITAKIVSNPTMAIDKHVGEYNMIPQHATRNDTAYGEVYILKILNMKTKTCKCCLQFKGTTKYCL